MNTDLQIERQRLIDLGCVEMKSIASKTGQRFRKVVPWQDQPTGIWKGTPLHHGPVLEVVGYWQVENGNGYRVSVYGDDLCFPTEDEREPDIYAKRGFTMDDHTRILLADVA